MRDPRQGPELEDVTVAALIAQLFTIYLLVIHVVAAPSEDHWAHADPILTLLPRAPTLWIAPLVALALAAAWWRIARPSRRVVVQGAKGALLGAVLAATAVTALRLGAGSTMPSFIPPEESAGPGFVLSMTAGFEEELGCRLGVMPLGYFVLRERAPRAIAIAASVVLTAAEGRE